MQEHEEEAFESFRAEGLITDVMMQLKSGKEATVYLCRATRLAGHPLAAAKIYRPREQRDFRNTMVYAQGRHMPARAHRERRAMEKHTRFGRQLDEAKWVGREHEALVALHAAGADVPRPIARSGQGLLMEYVGDEDGPARQLRHVALSASEATSAFVRLMSNVELFLAHDVIHADLSPFNILYLDGRVAVIDFPQSVDPRTNHGAYGLLCRDVEALCGHFARFGVRKDAEALASDLWTRFLFADL